MTDYVEEYVTQSLRKDWMTQRRENIKASVTAYDVLTSRGIDLYSPDSPQQLPCPFHGIDNRPSARYFPDTEGSPAGLYCHTCHKRWDVIGLWKEFENLETYGQAIKGLEQHFNIVAPPFPKEARRAAPIDTRFQDKYNLVEKRLILAKPAFKRREDLLGFLSLSYSLDKLNHAYSAKKVKTETALEALDKVLAHISKRESV